MKKLLYIIYAFLLIANASFAQIIISTKPGISKGDSTGYKGYATRKALVDTASALRTAMGSGSINSEAVYIDTLGSPSVNTLQDWLRTSQSAGKMYGGDITDNGNGSISVSAGEGFIKTSNSDTARTQAFSWDANSSVSLADGEVNYVCVDYNGGSPVISTSTSLPSDHSTKIMLGLVYRDGTSLHIVTAGQTTSNFASKVTWKDIEVNGKLQRASGLVISESGERYIHITAGVIYAGFTKVNIDAFDSQNAADSLTAYYRNNSGGWVKVTGVHQLDNQYYDDGGGSLASLNNNYKTCRYIYVDANGSVFMVYGQNQYATLGGAIEESAPSSLPNVVSGVCTLVGKIIVKEGEDNFEKIYSPFEAKVEYGAVTEHNELGDIQGGSADEYYHLTEGEHTELSDWLPHVDLTPSGGIDADDDVTAPNISTISSRVDSVANQMSYYTNAEHSDSASLGSRYFGVTSKVLQVGNSSYFAFKYAYWGNTDYVMSVEIDTSGGTFTTTPVDDKDVWYNGSEAFAQVGNSGVFVLAHGEGDSLKIVTVKVNPSNGDIADDNIDTLKVFSAFASGGGVELASVGSKYIAVLAQVTSDSTCLKTVEVNPSSGVFVGEVDSLRFLGRKSSNATGYGMFKVAGSDYYGLLYNLSPTGDIYLSTIDIDSSNGSIGNALVATREIDASGQIGANSVGVRVGVSDIYALVVSEYDVSNKMYTVEISPATGSISSVIETQVISSAEKVGAASVLNMNNIFALCYLSPNDLYYKIYEIASNGDITSTAIDSGLVIANRKGGSSPTIAKPSRIGNTNYFVFAGDSSYWDCRLYIYKVSGINSWTYDIAQKVNKADSTGHSPNTYATRSALLDSLEEKVSVKDSTGTSEGSYATRSALVDTAISLREGIPLSDTLRPKMILFKDPTGGSLLDIQSGNPPSTVDYGVIQISGSTSSVDTSTTLSLTATDYFDDSPVLQMSTSTLKIRAFHRFVDSNLLDFNGTISGDRIDAGGEASDSSITGIGGHFAGGLKVDQNINVGDGGYVATDKVRARDGDGLYLTDDGGNGIFVKDGGKVAINHSSPNQELDVNGDGVIMGRMAIGYTDIDLSATLKIKDPSTQKTNLQLIGGDDATGQSVEIVFKNEETNYDWRFRLDKDDGDKFKIMSDNAATTVIGMDANYNIGFNTITFGTSAAKVLGIGAGTAPTSSPADITQMWTDTTGGSAELKVRDEAGNVTTLSANVENYPSDIATSEIYPYVTYKENVYAGVGTYIAMNRLAELIQELAWKEGLLDSSKYIIKYVDIGDRKEDWDENESRREQQLYDKALQEYINTHAVKIDSLDAYEDGELKDGVYIVDKEYFKKPTIKEAKAKLNFVYKRRTKPAWMNVENR